MNFEAKGKQYVLSFNYNAICDIEEAAGVSIGQLFSEQKAGPATVRLVVWGGLKSRIPGITRQKAGEIVEAYLMENGLDKYQTWVQSIIKEIERAVGSETSGDEGEGAGE